MFVNAAALLTAIPYLRMSYEEKCFPRSEYIFLYLILSAITRYPKIAYLDFLFFFFDTMFLIAIKIKQYIEIINLLLFDVFLISLIEHNKNIFQEKWLTTKKHLSYEIEWLFLLQEMQENDLI